MRCSICDYSNQGPSLFHDGLNHGSTHYEKTHYRKRRMIRSKNGKDFYCDDCYSTIIQTQLEMIQDEQKDEFIIGEIPNI